MDDHPTPVELEGFVWNQLTSERVGAVVAHLVRGCEACRSVVGLFFCALAGPGEPPEVKLSPQEDAAYDAAIGRAIAVALKAERESFESRKQEALSLLTGPNLEALSEIPSHLRGIPMFEALLERSWSFRHGCPEQMVRFATWARLLSERWEAEELGVNHVTDYQCRAWIEVGNAYRVADDLAEADQALGRATELFILGSRDEGLGARLFTVQASLYASRRQFDLAITALNLVLGIYRRRGDWQLASRVLIKKGIYVGYQGQADEAVRLIEEGVSLHDGQDLQLLFAAVQSQARFLMDCGQFREARKVLFSLKQRGIDPGGRINELKVRWLEGQINAGLRQLDRAERDLREVQQGFEVMGLGYKAALAGLELGAVLLRQNRLDETCETVLGAAAVFMTLGVEREARTSVLLLHRTFEKKMADPVLLDYVIHLLRGLEDRGGMSEPPVEY